MMPGAASPPGPVRAAAMLSEAAATVSADGPTCRWHVEGPRLELLTLEPQVFRRDRESVIAAGESLLAVRVLLRSQGALCAADLLPDPGRPDLVAMIRVDGFARASAADHALAEVLTGPARNPPGAGTVDPAALLARLKSAARQEHAWLALMDSSSSAPPRASGGAAPGSAANDVVIGTTLDVPSAQLQAGQAARRVVLIAATAGLRLQRPPGGSPSGDERAAIRAHLGGGVWPQVQYFCLWDTH